MSEFADDLHALLESTFTRIDRATDTFTHQLTPRDVGTIASVSTGIAKVSGLPGVGYEELLEFPGGVFGIAFNVDEDDIGVVLLGDYWRLRAGDEVQRTGRVMDVGVGDGLLGRVIDPLGRPLDDLGSVMIDQRLPIERPAPAIMDRLPVTEPLQTGVKVIDALVPIGRGQRELIMGDRQTGKTAIAIDTLELYDRLQRNNLQLTQAYDATIEGWSMALDLRDRETEGHTLRVTDLTVKLAFAMGVSDEDLVHIRRGALLHDMGKLGVPDSILLKPGELTEEEWAVMIEHPRMAYNMLSPSEYLRPALDIPYSHHEKWDGTGYPNALKGTQIPLAARIFAVVDVYDALTSDRPYREAWPMEKTLAHIREQAGTHFDPQVVEAFFKMIEEI